MYWDTKFGLVTVEKGKKVDLKEIESPKFSGKIRNYGHCKQEVEQSLNIQGKFDIEIGGNVLVAFSCSYQHGWSQEVCWPHGASPKDRVRTRNSYSDCDDNK